MENTFEQHLINRGLKPSFYSKVYIDYRREVVTFPLWSCTGQLLGYQKYDWRENKLRNNDRQGRYYTYRRKDWLTFWGLDCIDLTSKEPLYVVEGVWDAVSVLNAGYRCIAVLSNNPQQLKNLLKCLPCKTVALCEGDKAGRMLSRVCDTAIYLQEMKDCNDMTEKEIKLMLEG